MAESLEARGEEGENGKPDYFVFYKIRPNFNLDQITLLSTTLEVRRARLVAERNAAPSRKTQHHRAIFLSRALVLVQLVAN
jgi:hypothetical protein